MNLPVTNFTLLYNGKDITNDISVQALSIEYDDKVKGESDEIQVTLEDTDKRWQNSWYPDKGATLQLYLRAGSHQLNCGSFAIDEIECHGSMDGDTFSIKAIAAPFSKNMRSKISYAHENKSLREIANTIAAGLGLTVQGTIADIRPARTHQFRETDLQFLHRLGSQFGYIFSVRGSQLIFTHYTEIENRSASLVFTRKDLVSWNIKDSTHLTYKNGRIRYHDPSKKKVIGYSTPDSEDVVSTSDDTLEQYDRVEDEDQAQTMAEYGLHEANSFRVGGEFATQGNLLLLSGNNVQLQGIGKFSGIYQILNSHHSLNRDGGYKSTAQVKRVKLIDPSLYK
jgi:phage protein D